MRSINLASRPFLNKRPVLRVALLLWALALVAFVINLWLYGDFLRATQVNRGRLAELQETIAAEQESMRQAEARLGALDLGSSNLKAAYLNQLIEQRTFPWNRLFDDLESVIPKDVLLQAVKPALEKQDLKMSRATGAGTPARNTTTRRTTSRTSRSGTSRNPSARPPAKKKAATPATKKVALELEGTARTDEAMLDFVDILFSHPAFSSPLLSTEAAESGLVHFRISVDYDTGVILDSPFVLPPELGGPSVLPGSDDVAANEPAEGSFGTPNPGAPFANPSAGSPAGRGDASAAAGRTAGRDPFRTGRADNSAAPPGRTARSSGTGREVAPPSTVYGGSGFVPPGGAAVPGRGAGRPTPGNGIVPPKNLPIGLNPSQSASPRLRSGGGLE